MKSVNLWYCYRNKDDIVHVNFINLSCQALETILRLSQLPVILYRGGLPWLWPVVQHSEQSGPWFDRRAANISPLPVKNWHLCQSCSISYLKISPPHSKVSWDRSYVSVWISYLTLCGSTHLGSGCRGMRADEGFDALSRGYYTRPLESDDPEQGKRIYDLPRRYSGYCLCLNRAQRTPMLEGVPWWWQVCLHCHI